MVVASEQKLLVDDRVGHGSACQARGEQSEAHTWGQAWHVSGAAREPVHPGRSDGGEEGNECKAGQKGAWASVSEPGRPCLGFGLYTASDRTCGRTQVFHLKVGCQEMRGCQGLGSDCSPTGTGLLFRMMKMSWNEVVLLTAQPCTYTKHRRISCYQTVSFMLCELCLY